MIPKYHLEFPLAEQDVGRAGYRARVRVAIVTDYCFPQLGGISEVVHAQALGLTARGHEVTVVTGHLLRRPEVVDDPRPPHAGAYEIIRTGAAIPLFGNGSATLHTIPPMLTETLRRLFRKRRFDVVHVHAPYNPGMCLIAPLAIPWGTIGVGTYHSVFEPGKGLNTFGRLMRWSLAKLDGHVVVAPACVDSLERYFPFDYEYIPNGVDSDRYRPEGAQIEELRRDGKPVILFLGRFDPRNGLGTALKAFEQVHAERKGDARLVICGDGPLKHIYRRQLSESVAADVHWAGRVDWSRPSYYRSADVLCIPCQKAACSMVPLEGMASGVPIVASRIPGFELAVDHGRQGLLVDRFEEHEGFAESVLHLLERPDERLRMSVEGRERALEVYSLDAITRQYEELYARLRGETPDVLPPPRSEPVRVPA
jgi:phosphatidylinositol alpha-mannosyltransferase